MSFVIEAHAHELGLQIKVFYNPTLTDQFLGSQWRILLSYFFIKVSCQPQDVISDGHQIPQWYRCYNHPFLDFKSQYYCIRDPQYYFLSGMELTQMRRWMMPTQLLETGWASSPGAHQNIYSKEILSQKFTFKTCSYFRENCPPIYHVKCGIRGRILISLIFEGNQKFRKRISNHFLPTRS